MTILLLTQKDCHFCEQAKGLLTRLEPEYGFSVSTLDIASPEGQSLAEQNGIFFPPGIFLDGVAFSYGRPSERKLQRELERRLRAGERRVSEPSSNDVPMSGAQPR